MAAKGKKSSKEIPGNVRTGVLVMFIISLLLLVIMMKKSRDMSAAIASFREREALLQAEITREEERVNEIKELEKYMQTDEFIQETARERLGLVKDDEIVFEEAD